MILHKIQVPINNNQIFYYIASLISLYSVEK